MKGVDANKSNANENSSLQKVKLQTLLCNFIEVVYLCAVNDKVRNSRWNHFFVHINIWWNICNLPFGGN